MARIEGLMEMMVQERGLASGNVRGSIESDKASSSREPQGANASAHLIDTPNTNPISTRQLFVTPHDSLFRRASLDSLQLPVQNVFSSQQKPAFLIRVGSRTLPFKTEAEYHVCIDFFFSDINTLFPCVNETEFRSRMGTASTRRFQEGDDLCFLALNYVMFACLETCASGLVRPGGVPNGWEWFKLADELLEKRKISGRADIDLIQALIYEVCSPHFIIDFICDDHCCDLTVILLALCDFPMSKAKIIFGSFTPTLGVPQRIRIWTDTELLLGSLSHSHRYA